MQGVQKTMKKFNITRRADYFEYFTVEAINAEEAQRIVEEDNPAKHSDDYKNEKIVYVSDARQWVAEFGESWTVPSWITESWEDISWHNDACPSFTHKEIDIDAGQGYEDDFRIFVDHPEPQKRDNGDSWGRFCLIINEETNYMCESEAEFKEYLASYKVQIPNEHKKKEFQK